MTKEDLIKECLKFENCTASNPYGPDVEVMKNEKGKSFALIGVCSEADTKSILKNCDQNAPVNVGDLFITLKCPPALIIVLREKYKAVIPGYYSNKNHWNTIILGKDVPNEEVKTMINMSFELVGGKK